MPHLPNVMPQKIIPVILSGGMGTRLWPMSRESYPKQFLKLSSPDASLIQETVLRLSGLEPFETLIVVSNLEHRFLVAEQLLKAGVTSPSIILEPCGRNTAPAVAVAAEYIRERFGDALMLVLPSDHIIKDKKTFLAGIERASALAQEGYLVTFGITPEYAETGYGYIKHGKAIEGTAEAYAVSAFIEKPDAKTAEQYVASKEYLWNSGMFLFPASAYLDELAELQPHISTLCATAIRNRLEEKDFIRLEEQAFSRTPSLSIDYAVMEKTRKAAVVALDCGWNDAGSWDSLWRIGTKNKDGNVLVGTSYNINTKNSYVSCEDGPAVSTLGVDDLVIISTKDSVLVAKKQCSQDIKLLVEHVRSQDKSLIANHRRVYRPWGYYHSIDSASRHQVKRINVKPGAKLSLQMHYHRAEHWIIVRGTAKVVCGGNEKILVENESIYIPQGVTHRIENPGKIDLDIIEVQTGSYLEEDDIVRFEDKYGRNEKAKIIS